MSNAFKRIKHRLISFALQMKQRITPTSHAQRSAIFKNNLLAFFQRFGSTNVGNKIMLTCHPLYQHFNLATGFLFSEQARGNNTSVIEHEQVARL